MSNKQTKREGRGKVVFQGFLNFNLSRVEKDKARELVRDGIDFVAELSELLESGYSVKFDWDSYSDCPSVIVFGGAGSGSDAGYGVSSRHSDLSVAIAAMLVMRDEFTDADGKWLKGSDIASEWDW